MKLIKRFKQRLMMQKMRKIQNEQWKLLEYRLKMKEKEKQMQDYKSKYLIDELSKMSPMVIATAYLYATNYISYGEDVTEKWVTATQNASALRKAYEKGYYDALNDITKCDQIKRGE